MTKRICAIVVKSSAAVPGEISAKLETAIRMGCSGFLSGLEYGAGLTAAETILQRKADRPCLTLECVIPYEEYTSAWDEPSRDRYFDIVSRCDKETMLMHRYAPDCMALQREYLLRKGDIMRNYGNIAKNYGYHISVIDLRNPTRSNGNNLLHLVNKYMDLYLDDPEQLVYKAKAEKYAKIMMDLPEGQSWIFEMVNNILIEVLGTIAEQERVTIQQRQAEGIAAAKAKGKRFGRPTIKVPENWDQVYATWKRGEITAKTAMELTQLKRTSFYKLAREMEE